MRARSLTSLGHSRQFQSCGHTSILWFSISANEIELRHVVLYDYYADEALIHEAERFVLFVSRNPLNDECMNKPDDDGHVLTNEESTIIQISRNRKFGYDYDLTHVTHAP